MGKVSISVAFLRNDVLPRYKKMFADISTVHAALSDSREQFFATYGEKSMADIYESVNHARTSLGLFLEDLECLIDTDDQSVDVLPGTYKFYMECMEEMEQATNRMVLTVNLLIERPWDRVNGH